MKGQSVKDFVMTMPDVCQLLQRSRRGVYKVMERYPDFPEPLARGHGIMMMWLKADMLSWYKIHKDELAKVKGGRGIKKCADQK